MPSKNSGKDSLDGALDPMLQQEKFFKPPLQDMNRVFEIGLAEWGIGDGTAERGGRVRIEFGVGAIGEEPVQSDENKVGEDLLFDTALGPAVKVLNVEDTFAHLVKLFDAPSAMVDVDEVLERISLRIEQGGTQAKWVLCDSVFEEA